MCLNNSDDVLTNRDEEIVFSDDETTSLPLNYSFGIAAQAPYSSTDEGFVFIDGWLIEGYDDIIEELTADLYEYAVDGKVDLYPRWENAVSILDDPSFFGGQATTNGFAKRTITFIDGAESHTDIYYVCTMKSSDELSTVTLPIWEYIAGPVNYGYADGSINYYPVLRKKSYGVHSYQLK